MTYGIPQVGVVDLCGNRAVLYLPYAVLLLQVAQGQGGRDGRLGRTRLDMTVSNHIFEVVLCFILHVFVIPVFEMG